ncbi:MAG: hypothetical protein JJ850_06945 [Kordiimonadaceae bacterium]|nr:hypothetical protein [Kordiimonadaceae bacterium]MBO6567934.1 hypothetical protein [Kordiimonadaceae bacterium]MBO6964336.1 hypothetical protein [Kordiimonadaceae bacterium]
MLLNPGLEFRKVIGPNGKSLPLSSDVRPIAGSDGLQLSHAVVKLTTPISSNSRAEIIIHYKGFLQDLSVGGLFGVKETLHPDFTMIRAKGGAYPLFGLPEINSLRKSWENKPFLQVAFIDMPGDNTVVGNLKVSEKSLKGDVTSFMLKSDLPTNMMTLAIGPYEIEQTGIIKVAKLPFENGNRDQNISYAIKDAEQITDALGQPPRDSDFQIIDLAEGFHAEDRLSVSFQKSPTTPLPPNGRQMPEPIGGRMFIKVSDVWGLGPGRAKTSWENALNHHLKHLVYQQKRALPRTADSNVIQTTDPKNAPAFDTLKKARNSVDKIPLIDFTIEGLEDEEQVAFVLMLPVLNDLMGTNAYITLATDMRTSLGRGYTDMETIGEYLLANLSEKRARKFVNNWFFKGTIGKDLANANTLAELVALYE